MAKVNVKVMIDADIELVWAAVTSLENYKWRSELEKIEILEDGKSFIEHTKDGYSTKFEITVFEPLKRYEFNIINKNIEGNWIGCFEKSGEKTLIDFTENITATNILMKPFVKMYIKKQQANYIRDLILYLDKK